MRRLLWLLTGVVLSSGCGSPQPIRIGIVLDGDGERGATLAASDVNAAGGIRGRPLELRILRGLSSTSAKVALTAADSLANDPTILGVVGHTNSSASLAAAQVYNEHRLVQIAPTTTAPLFSEAGPYSFRLVASDSHQGTFLANIVLADSARPRTALAYVNDDYGRALHESFVRSLSAHGVTPVYEGPYSEADRFVDIEDIAHAITRSRPSLLVWLGRAPELRRLLPALRARLPNLRVLASDGFSGPGVRFDSSGAIVGVRYVRFVDIGNPTPAERALRERFDRIWKGEEYTDQYLMAYQAVRLLAEAIRVEGDNREAIQRFLSQLGTKRPPFAGISGPIAFDANGDPSPSYHLAEVTESGSRSVDVHSVPSRPHP
jgi:branched-chain amino acid transport system substrate-binding protein